MGKSRAFRSESLVNLQSSNDKNSYQSGLNFVKFGMTGIGPAMKEFQQGDYERGGEAFMRAGVTPARFAKLSEERLQQIRINAKPHAAFIMGAGPGPITREQREHPRQNPHRPRGRYTSSAQAADEASRCGIA